MAKNLRWYETHFLWRRLRPNRRYKDRLSGMPGSNAEHQSRAQPKTAITKAIDNCIAQGILEDILRKNRAEVLNMLLTEYDEKKHMNTIYQEGYEEGEQAGYNAGKQVGYREGERAGYHEGEQGLLEKLVQKKLERGKNASEIAEELEIDLSVSEEIITKIESHKK